MVVKTLPPNPSRLIEGLRDTGYNFNTALADIVDNSVDAGAEIIDIRIRMDQDGDILITVADDGCGMSENELLDGMTYGAQGRDDPKRLGKFGLGLKTASTAFCRRLSVISRPSVDEEPIKAIWDLDHVVRVSEWELLIEDPSTQEMELLDNVAKQSSGTLVIWDMIDRILKDYSNPGSIHARNALDKKIKEFNHHISMIYQRFLDPNDKRARDIKIIVNGDTIEPWDPFCDSEPESEVVAAETQAVELFNGTGTEFTVRAVVLPRREQFSTEAKAKVALIENKYQGIYVYRENRLIHPHDWLGMFMKEPHITLLRVEFSFNHELDEAFQVDIKKSRILLNEDLFNFLKTQFLPAPRNAANERYRRGQRLTVNEQAKNAHDDSNRSIGAKEEDLRMADVKASDTNSNEAEVINKLGKFRMKIDISSSPTDRNVNVQPVNSIDDGLLWMPALINGHHAVKINTGHPYYHKVYVTNHNSGVIIQGLDSLLWALTEAELGTYNDATLNHFSELRFEVSRLLRKLVEDLPEPQLVGDSIDD